MAGKRQRARKPKIVGTMVVDGKEIPVVQWLDAKEGYRRWLKERRKKARELERERREVEKALNKGKGKLSLLDVLIQQRNALRGWEDEEEQ